ncbi:hypothetical protein D3C76_1315950 [compost metagenome]
MPAMGHETTVAPQVADRCLRRRVGAENEPAAHRDHHHDCAYFDDCEPELRLTINLDVEGIDAADQYQKEPGRCPGWKFGPPELHVFTECGKFGHAHQKVSDGIVPAGEVAHEATAVFIAKMAKRSGDGFIHQHLAQLAHDQKSDEPCNHVANQQAWPRRLDNTGTAQEQASANGPAQPDHLNMPV